MARLKSKDRDKREMFVLLLFKRDIEQEQKSSISNSVLLQRDWEERAALWLNPKGAKTHQSLPSETHKVPKEQLLACVRMDTITNVHAIFFDICIPTYIII